jgi:hypothetical protein
MTSLHQFQLTHRHPESLKISVLKADVSLCAVLTNAGDYINRSRSRGYYSIADAQGSGHEQNYRRQQ